MNSEHELKSKVFYYLRERLYHTMQATALEGIMKHPGNVQFKYFNAIAMMFTGRLQESLREMESLQKEEDLLVATLVASIYINKRKQVTDKQVYVHLDQRLKESRKKASSTELYYAAIFLFANDKIEKARDYVEKALKLDQNIDALCLKGWIDIHLIRNGTDLDSTMRLFHSINQGDKRNLDAYLGEIECLELENKLEAALALANKVIIKFPSIVEPVIRKMKTCFAVQDFDQMSETINRVISTESNNIEGAKYKILLLLCHEGNLSEALNHVRTFYKVLEKSEPKNAVTFYENGRLFSRICNRNKLILGETYTFIQKAMNLDDGNQNYVTEAGFQCLLSGKIKEASKHFKMATKMSDETCTDALIGMMLCELTENGISEQIHHQMEFMMEIEGIESNAMLLFIRSKLNMNKPDLAIKLLDKLIETHMKALQLIPFGDKYLNLLDPDFLLDVTKEYLNYAPKEIEKKVVKPSKTLSKCLEILKTVTGACPGLLDGLLLQAKVQFLIGDTVSSTKTLQNILKSVDVSSVEAHLLLAQIYIQQNLYQRAAASLEMGLSYNFKVRENPLYHYITGLVYKSENNLDEEIKSLTTALTLINLSATDTSFKNDANLSLADKASLYMELIMAYSETNQPHEAAKFLHNAIEEFSGTPEEARFIILNAEQSLNKKDIKTAIDVLNKIKPEEPYYMQARTKLAEIYLEKRRDKAAYMQCFREIVENCPGPESFLLFGDACMSIQEPDRAIDAYERALNFNPKDPGLACKMGIALVKTHNYAKAISYYKEAIQTTEPSELKMDLAKLYVLLKQFDKAEIVIKEELENNKKFDDDYISLQNRTTSLLLLAKIQEKSGNITTALLTLKEAKDCQNRVQKRLPIEQPANVQEQLNISRDICVKMAELSLMMRESEKAIHLYKEALTINSTDPEILLALAKLYMQINYMELCQQTCSTLLTADPDNEAASVMMADIAFRKVDFDTAAYHFKQLLNKQPTYWTALARLVEVMRRTGGLEQVPPHLKKAEEMSDRPAQVAGLAYCNGLYEWYTGNPNAALRHFNNARHDPEWGQQSIYNMIEICLNPEDEMLGDAFDSIEDLEYRDSRTMALRTAERLLKELKPRPGGIDDEALRHRLLGNFLLLSTKQKTNIERALEDFTLVASQDTFKDHIGPILGVASAYILLKQQQRAKNQLKRVSKNVWTFEDAEYLERCWLLLADLYIQSAKYDFSTELLKKVLQHNKTCVRAYEYLGFISEKEQRYKEAAFYYENAWRYGGKINPSIGYKLAYNFMKCKKYADAIDIGNHVLKIHPEYPKIKKDILDKSLNNLRT